MRIFIFLLSISIGVFACSSASTGETTQADNNTKQATAPKTKKVANTTTISEGAVKWLTFEEAQKMSAKNPKDMIVDVYTYWCGPCKMMDRMTFTNPDVAKAINEKFYPVKFNAESPDAVTVGGQKFENPGYRADIPKNRRNSPHQLVRELGVRGYPSLVVMDDQLNIKASIVGFKQPAQLLQELARF